MKTVLLTGASGFLGKAIIRTLTTVKLIGLGRSSGQEIKCDLSKEVPILPTLDIVIHAAGKAHSVPRTLEEQREFFDVNLQGTKNLISALDTSAVKLQSFILISSVSVYGLESGIEIDEEYPLNAKDPYGLSKIEAEKVVKEWCDKKGVICAILRLPLIAGPNPPGNLGAMINGIKKGFYLNIAGGKARKSVVLASDIALIIEKAAAIGGTYNLTDCYNPSFAELSASIAKQLGKSQPMSIPPFIAGLIGKIGDVIGEKAPVNTNKIKKITSDLTFNNSKAKKFLNWNPIPVLDGFILK